MNANVLTDEERNALKGGEAVPIEIDGTRCVLVRQDIYDRGMAIPNGELDPKETYAAVLKAWDEEPDPGLDAYQEFKKR